MGEQEHEAGRVSVVRQAGSPIKPHGNKTSPPAVRHSSGSGIGQSLEHVVNKCCRKYKLQYKLNTRDQSKHIQVKALLGFCSGRGTADCLFNLRRVVKLARAHATPMHAAFVDFSKAFDSVNHEALWEVLEARGIHPKLISLIKDGPLPGHV